MNNGSSFNTMPASTSYGGQQQPQDTMTPEAQISAAIMIEAQREQWKQQGNPAVAIIPPTVLTPKNSGAESSPGGMPPIP
jgi:hypothetical protein